MIPAYALGLSVAEEGTEGVAELSKTFLFTQTTTELIKGIVKEKRPNYKKGDRKDSFPSGHTAAAFSGASFIHRRYGIKQAILPYTCFCVLIYENI